MIDAANPRDRDGHDIIIELVTNIKNFESQLIETISNVDQADLVDYAIKVNEDCQSTVKRFKQLQKGQKPDQYIQASSANNFIRPPEEEVKLEVTSDAMSDVRSIISAPPMKFSEKHKKHKHRQVEVDRNTLI